MARSRLPLAIIQQAFVFLVIFLSIISSPRTVLFVVSSQQNMPQEFLIGSLAYTDVAAILLILVSFARLVLDSTYRVHCSKLFDVILGRFGGFAWFGLVVWAAISTRWADNVGLASFGGLHILLGVAAAIFVASLIDSEAVLRRFLWMLVASMILQAVVGIAQVIVQGPLGLSAFGEVGRFYWDSDAFYRARGLSEHYNYFGGCLALSLFACLVLLRPLTEGKRVVPRAVIVLIMALLLGGMAGSLSRSAFVGSFVGALPLLAWAVRALPRRILIGSAIGIAMVVLIVGAIALRGNLQNAETRILGAREFFFSYSIKVIQQAPILGVGEANLMIRIGANEGVSDQPVLPVHNVYLFIWAELGIPGLILYLIGVGIVFWRSRLWQIAQMSAVRIWGCAILVICVIILFDNYFWAVDPHRMTFFWVLGVWWGCAIWSERVSKQQAASIAPESNQVPLELLKEVR